MIRPATRSEMIKLLLNDYKEELETLSTNELKDHCDTTQKLRNMTDEEWQKIMDEQGWTHSND